MKSCFQWAGSPSVTAAKLSRRKVEKPALKPKRFHIYAEVAMSDESRENLIRQTNEDMQIHFLRAQTVDDKTMRVFHRDEAIRLAGKVRDLVAGRSAEYIAKLEKDRGIA